MAIVPRPECGRVPCRAMEPGWWNSITVEPTMFFATMAYGFSFQTIQLLILQKMCSPESMPPIGFVCNDTAIVSEATELVSARGTLRTALSAFSTVVAGSWRDARGRNRPLLFLSLAAELLGVSAHLAAAAYWPTPAWVPAILEAVLCGLFGESILQMAAACVVRDHSTTAQRTMRMQIFSLATFIGGAFAGGSYGVILTQIGFVWFLGVTLVLNLVALLLAIILVKEIERPPNEVSMWQSLVKMKAVFQSRPNNAVVWMMVVCNCLLSTFFSAEANVLLYSLQQGYHMTISEIGGYGSFRLTCGIVGSIVIPAVAIKVFKWSDFKLGIASAALSASSCIATALATTRIYLYLTSPLDALKYAVYSLPKSILSKSLKGDEFGIFVGVGSIPAVFLPFIVNYLYSEVFTKTYTTLPGAFYFLSAANYIVVLVILCFSVWLYTPIEIHAVTENTERMETVKGNEPVTVAEDA